MFTALPEAPSAGPDSPTQYRRREWFRAGHAEADVLVLGGGAVGAATYHHLARSGLRVVLAEPKDFASGSSQGSANLIWGGLLYLRSGHLGEVISWCRERNRLLGEHPQCVAAHRCNYRIDPKKHHPLLVHAALGFYWALGGLRGGAPRRVGCQFHFDEARLTRPDARFTWDWIAGAPGPGIALNYCAAGSICWRAGRWQVQLRDLRGGGGCNLQVRWIVNAAGPWAETVNEAAGIQCGWRLELSRGTSLVVPGRNPECTEIFDHPEIDDALSLVPFGQAAIWGSTETLVDSPGAGFAVPAAEVATLLSLYRRLIGPLDTREVIAVRCGVRALAVRKGSPPRRSQQLGRAFRILVDNQRPWVTVFGGKLSGCAAVARRIVMDITGRRLAAAPALPRVFSPRVSFPGLPLDLPSPAFCRDYEQCHCLEDYLRRRTPIAQLVHRGGLGSQGQWRAELARIALILADDDALKAALDLQAYEAAVVAGHDALLNL